MRPFGGYSARRPGRRGHCVGKGFGSLVRAIGHPPGSEIRTDRTCGCGRSAGASGTSSFHSHRMLAFQVILKKLILTQKSLPKLRPRWALVRVRMAGICNTDVEILRGYHNFDGTPGHEFVGQVQDVAGASAALKKRWIGKRVAGEINIACRALGFS